MNGFRKCGVYIHGRIFFGQKKHEIMLFSGKWVELEIIKPEG
jgi:hypothetical protein